MTKRCMYLSFSQKLAPHKSSVFNFGSSAFTTLVSPQLLIFSANEPLFQSQQPSTTNRQTRLRTTHQSKEKLWKQRTKQHSSVLRSWERKNNGKRSYRWKGHVSREIYINIEKAKLYVAFILIFNKSMWRIFPREISLS